MKTKFLLVLSTIFFVIKFTALCQTSWLITGNSNITTSNFIGTTNSQPLIMKTNNKERLRILPSGNIGIGTKTPDNTLHVFKGSAGTVTGWPYAPLVVENSAQCYINLLAPDNLETGVFFGKPQSNISGGIIYNNTLSGANSLQFRTGGNQIRMVIDANGHAGINTNTPNPNFGLTVNGSANGITTTGDQYGVFSVAASHDGTVGVHAEGNAGIEGVGVINGVFGYASAGWAGYFSGNVFCTGSYASSDQKLKQNIRDFTSALDIINKLQPKQYEFRQDGNYKLMNLPQGNHYGLIAQDVEKVLPNLVKDSKFETRMVQSSEKETALKEEDTKSETIEFKALNYTELIPVLIKAIQEQQQQINELKQLLSKLSSSLQSSSLNISTAYLKQNAPNPFSKNTIIQCYVPSAAANAQLIIYNLDGRQLKSFTLNSTGMNEVTINGSTLSSGEYIYSLLVDGKKVNSKKMIIVR